MSKPQVAAALLAGAAYCLLVWQRAEQHQQQCEQERAASGTRVRDQIEEHHRAAVEKRSHIHHKRKP